MTIEVLPLDTTAVATPDGGAKRKGAMGSLLILALTIMMAATMRQLFSPMQEGAKAALGLTDNQLGLVQGLAVAIPIAIISLPLGRMVDRGRRVWILVAMALVWSAGTALTAFATDFNILFFARMLAGVGGICALPVAISLTADLSPPEQRGRSMAWLGMGNVAGAAFAFVGAGVVYGGLQAAPPLLGLEAWRAVHLIFAALSALMVIPLLTLREPVRQEVSQAHASFSAAMSAIWARRSFLAPLFLGQIAVSMIDTAAGIWAAPVLARDFQLTPDQFGPWLGLTILVSGILGTVIGGLAADLGQKAKFKGGILVGGVILSVVAIPAALYPLMPTVTGFALTLGVLLVAGFALGLITAVALSVLVPNEIRGLCLSAFIVIAAILGLGVAPSLITWISGLMGGEQHLAASLAWTGVAINVASAIGFAIAMFTAPRSATEA